MDIAQLNEGKEKIKIFSGSLFTGSNSNVHYLKTLLGSVKTKP